MVKRQTRFAALLLALILLASAAAALPAAAASTAVTGFSDVSDSSNAADIECLRLLGVLDGYSNNTFAPAGTLTRAQFCKMAAYAMNAQDLVGQYRAVTVYPDVKPSYWAAAYINLAAKGKKIIAGYPDGKFYPGRTVTYAQAVTILVRLLGYADADVGTVWPDGYIAQGDASGLTAGLKLSPSAALTRSQAATLFANLLRAAKKDSTTYASSIASTVVSNAMLSSSSATASDNSGGAMQLANGTVYQMAYKTSNGLLNGRKGTLLLNKQGKVMTFVPDTTGSSKVVTVSEAKATLLTDTAGGRYVLSASIPAYYNSKESTWGDVYSWMTPGTSLTLYFGSSGTVEYVFAGSGSVSTAAVVVYTQGSSAGFSSLTGGSTGYTIYKDGVKATTGDLKKYDVATYSSATNTIRVCDNRLVGYYEDCSPNTASPSTIKVLGHTFSVLPSAADTLSKFSLGQQLTLLLTEDNQVAGAVEASGNVATGNMIGIATSASASSATVNLLSGITITGSVSSSDSASSALTGQLVRVYSNQKGYIGLSKLSGGAAGDLDVVNRKLGTKSLSDNVMIFESNSGGVKAVSLSQLTAAKIPASQVLYASYDWADRAKVLVVVSAASSEYIFGRVQYTPGYDTQSTDDEGKVITTHTSASLTLIAGSKTYGPFSTSYDATSGFVGIKLNTDGDKIENLITLTKLGNVANSAWSGQNAVTVAGRTYTVASDVLCYNLSSREWVTLSAAHAFSSASTLYVDDYGIVRGVEVGQ